MHFKAIGAVKIGTIATDWPAADETQAIIWRQEKLPVFHAHPTSGPGDATLGTSES